MAQTVHEKTGLVECTDGDCETALLSALLHVPLQYLRRFIDCMDHGVAFLILIAIQDATAFD